MYDYNGDIGQRECKVEGPLVWGTQKEVTFELSSEGRAGFTQAKRRREWRRVPGRFRLHKGWLRRRLEK